jgi:hypothetical protein
MILEHLKDFYRRPREIKAIEFLQRPESCPGLSPWREQDTRVRFVRLPAFQPYSVWALQHDEEVTQVRRVEWDHVADRQVGDAFPDSTPTVFGTDSPLPASAVNELFEELASISLHPFLPVSTFGIDGVSYAVAFGSSWRSACLSWWCKPPDQWQPLARCYERAISIFEQHLPISTARNPQLQTGA